VALDSDRSEIEAAAREAAWRVGVIVFLALLSLIIGATVWQRTVTARLDRSETRACERLQTQRERANVGEARDYLLMVAITRAPKASKMVRDEYAGLARTARYDPPTDCPDAVRRPNSYRRPASVPYCAADDPRLRCSPSLPTAFARSIVRAAQEGKPQPVKGA
jgi:hypothetical protein